LTDIPDRGRKLSKTKHFKTKCGRSSQPSWLSVAHYNIVILIYQDNTKIGHWQAVQNYKVNSALAYRCISASAAGA